MKRLKPIMLGGTGSDVGKSVITAGLCRIFRQDGYSPAPFKAQNMALNSYVTPDGLELGRAQAVQAEAAGVECEACMNPVLLKPTGDMDSQVVVLGRVVADMNARRYFREDNRRRLAAVAHGAFDRLSARYNPVVMEGAGSIAEINLMETDIVNIPMARYADAAVILVADIDRGGVFASVYGSIMLQRESDRRLIKGIIINKFRGDISLFEEGRRELERLCGVPVLGVVPYLRDVHIEDEDSVSVLKRNTRAADCGTRVNVAVVALRHMSNFTDFDTLVRDGRLHVYFTCDPDHIRRADYIILPGSKNTISDLRRLKEEGAAEAVLDAHRHGAGVLGICGGYQMLGRRIADPEGMEGEPTEEEGLGLLDTVTVLTTEKHLARVRFTYRGCQSVHEGYEVHMGATEVPEDAERPIELADGTPDGCTDGARVTGTYIHGFLDDPEVTDSLLGDWLARKGLPAESGMESHAVYKQRQYDMLAARLRECLDMEKLYDILTQQD
ncbi:MAG: cobyric acid synthase [Bacteroides sp.]|nr:cobyric acid synthase [Bacteroides sp.]